MTISLGGWITLIMGVLVLYGGLILCVRMAIIKGRRTSERESDEGA